MDSGGEVARFVFLDLRVNTGIIGKADVGKHIALANPRFFLRPISAPAETNSNCSLGPVERSICSSSIGHLAVARPQQNLEGKTNEKIQHQTPDFTYSRYGGGSSNIAHGVFSFSFINHIM